MGLFGGSKSKKSSSSTVVTNTDSSNKQSWDDHSVLDLSDNSSTDIITTDNRRFDDHSVLDLSDNSSTVFSTSSSLSNTNSNNTTTNTLDGGAIDALKSVAMGAFEFGGDTVHESLSFAEKQGAAAIASAERNASMSVNAMSVATTKALATNERTFGRAVDEISGSYETAFGDALDYTEDNFETSLLASNNAFESALVFADKKTTSENQQLLEGFQKNALYIAAIGAAVVILPRVFR